jgi:hypothetical protein
MTKKITTPLNDLVEKIRNAGQVRLTQKDVAEKMPCNETYLGQLMRKEREGIPAPKRFVRDMEAAFEVQLTGNRTVEIDPDNVIRNLIEENVSLRVWIDVLLKKVASLSTPGNPAYTMDELTRSHELEAESRLSAMRS